MSGLMFADDFVGTSETPEGLQKQIEKALEYTRKWRVTANVKKNVRGSAVVVQNNEDKENSETFKWWWGEDELPIVDQLYVPWRRDLKRMLLGCTHSEIDSTR